MRSLPVVRHPLGSDLSDDHPVSVRYEYGMLQSGASLRPPEAPSPRGGTIGADLLDPNGLVQCTSCHDPHSNVYGKFLVAPYEDGRLCETCHDLREFDLSAHSVEDRTGRGRGCPMCHTPHNSEPGTALLKQQEARLCGECHRAQGRWSLANRQTHGKWLVRGIRGASRRTMCSTCHEPHTVRRRLAYQFEYLTDPRSFIKPPRLIGSEYMPYNVMDEPYKAARAPADFCLSCHDGTWPGAVDIKSELANKASQQSEFTVGSTNLHYVHASPQARRRFGCTYCHDVHGSEGSSGINRGAGLYPWLRIREFPYTGKRSCGSADPTGGCH